MNDQHPALADIAWFEQRIQDVLDTLEDVPGVDIQRVQLARVQFGYGFLSAKDALVKRDIN